ncbi:hypothetical protein K458DRAFT_400901 [Lentithecium fluviatile CBS 122367]|uniref:RING-type domain-containing protein n=1 Tax=Lentithecium fluviatile CBS 122367 TaxID=1168545 RepID=A0A6G1JE71_9PLEO|nr:hypothetical protein K458DRAFT_400901 [Lentithecium fluviatile CBS 122367]
MADASPAPPRATYPANLFQAFHQCDICHESFDKDHVPARLEKCHHVFGSTCLQTWLESDMEGANKCPMCRTVLFERGDEGSDDDDDFAGEDTESDDSDSDIPMSDRDEGDGEENGGAQTEGDGGEDEQDQTQERPYVDRGPDFRPSLSHDDRDY